MQDDNIAQNNKNHATSSLMHVSLIEVLAMLALVQTPFVVNISCPLSNVGSPVRYLAGKNMLKTPTLRAMNAPSRTAK